MVECLTIMGLWGYCRSFMVLPLQRYSTHTGSRFDCSGRPPGLLFWRIANFINVNFRGRSTNVPWAVIFLGSAAQNCPNLVGVCSRHPEQFNEAGLEGLCWALSYLPKRCGAVLNFLE